MTPVYTGHVTVRHDELDRFGRAQPAAYLRHLAHVAVEASAAAGFDAAWYEAAGTHWIIRRSTLTVERPASAERLTVRTWVEDFRRVRSHRCYRMLAADGATCVEARTDWIYVDRLSGRPRRVPPEMEGAFGRTVDAATERAPWSAPSPPATPALAHHRVRHAEVDTVGHVNNAAWLDICAQGVLDVLEAAGWSLDRFVATGAVPLVTGVDVEYLAGARYGERLAIATWFTPGRGLLDAHQRVLVDGADRPAVQATTRWCWTGAAAAGDTLPAELLDALGPVLAA